MSKDISHNRLQLLSEADLNDKLARLRSHMSDAGLDSILVSENINIFYLTGRVFDGYIYITAEGQVLYFVRRPTVLHDPSMLPIRKPEDIPGQLAQQGIQSVGKIGLELSQGSYATVTRLAKALGTDSFGDADSVLLKARSVKTEHELKLTAQCGTRHDDVYHCIPHLYAEGMSDVELQVEIERISRLKGSIGIMRFTGQRMELNMGSVLAGANADTPSPYDFALGGAGTTPALPIGADGTILKPGMTVMVDTNGVFNGYMTDMTRTFSIGEVPQEAHRAHQLSIDICQRLQHMARPGVKCCDLYNEAMRMVSEAALEAYFMGHLSQAGFVGHGVGITVNELPVLSPRSKDVLQAGNVIALEPKFVLPHIGAVGVENTYAVTEDGPMHRFTNSPEEMIMLS